MRKHTLSLTFLLLISPVLITSCDINNQITLKELMVKGVFSKYTYEVGEAFNLGDDFKVYDKNTNEEISNYDIYLKNEVKIYDGYIFNEIGTYTISIKVNGYNDYTIPYNGIVVNDITKTLVVDTTNVKTEFKIGETFTSKGLIVKDNLGNIINDYSLSIKEGQEFTTPYEAREVRVYKEGYVSTSYNIKILDITRLRVDTSEAQLIYTLNSPFSLSGLIVKDSNGNLMDEYDSSIKEGEILSTLGFLTVTISKDGYYSTSFEIEVINEKIMKISKNPSKVDYIYGESLDLQGLEVIDSTTLEIINDFEIYIDDVLINNEYRFNEVGTHVVTLKKEGYLDVSFEVNVSEKSLVIDKLPNKVTYVVGEAFNSDGLIVSDGLNIVDEYSLSIDDGHIFKHSGEIEIRVSSDSIKNTSFIIKVINQKGMKIQNKPKVYFEKGEEFTLEGLELVDNNTLEDITSFTTNFIEGEILDEIGEFEVLINSEGYPSLSYTIYVNEKLNIGESKTINIYSINDTHGSFTRDETDYEAGMPYIGQYFKELKDENTLFLSAGDMWQGGIESNSTSGVIMSEAMNIMGIDAMTIGNHEFDWDVEAIYKNLSVMEFPLLGNNILYKDSKENVDFTKPYTIIDKANVKIGIIGSVMEGIGSSIIASVSDNFIFDDPIPYVKSQSDYLRSVGCDVIIYLSHDGGFEGYNGYPEKYEELTKISENSNKKYVDAMIFAHDHLRKEGIYNDVPFIEAGDNGSYIGNINLNIVRNNEDDYSINTYLTETNIINAYNNCLTSNGEIKNLLDIYSDVIINPDDVIYTFKRSYSQNEFTLIVCQALVWFMNENKYQFGNHNIYIGIHNFAGIRDGVNSGDFTYKDLIEVCPFSNSIALLKLTPNQVNYYYRNSALETYTDESVSIDSDGYYYGATISYVAERTDYNGNLYCTSYELFDDYIISDVVIEYLLNAPNLDL